MALSLLTLEHFRNIGSASLPVRFGQVFFTGNNGQGKTNVLEAIHYCSYGSSFRTSRDEECIQAGHDEALVIGEFDQDGISRQVRIVLRRGKKEIFLDGKLLRDRKELLAIHSCIVFSHDDISFIRGSPDDHRQFLNQTASLLYPGFIEAYRSFTRLLKTRNVLLKEQNRDVLPVITRQFVHWGREVVAYRQKTVSDFSSDFMQSASAINPDLDGLELTYRSSWDGMCEEDILEDLGSRFEQELRLGTSSWGPQRDKLMFNKDGRDFVPYASTGQARLLSLLLRLAQARCIASFSGKMPLLLVDDVLLELDEEKRRRFLQQLPKGEQEFYTFMPGVELTSYVRGPSLVYSVEGGSYIGTSI